MMSVECVSEMKAKECILTHTLLVSAEYHRIGQLIQCDSFSRLQKLLRVTVYVRKSINRHLAREVKFDLWKSQLNAFLEQQGVWRCEGQLNKANISYFSKHPILLSKQHHLTTLITQYTHERTMHDWVKYTLTETRLDCKRKAVRAKDNTQMCNMSQGWRSQVLQCTTTTIAII